jgi:hypothetical protein
MPMPMLDEITQPDPAGMGEVLNRNDYHTLDAKDHDGSMSHLGHLLRTYSGPMARQAVPLVESAAGLSPFYAQDIPARSD